MPDAPATIENKETAAASHSIRFPSENTVRLLNFCDMLSM
jgi:hypothetical protein